MRLSTLALATLALAATAPAAHAQRERQTDPRAFEWSGTVEPGGRLVIRNVNGPVTVGSAAGDEVEITAEKRWRRGDPRDVRIEATREGRDVVVCALWHDAECDADGYRGTRDRDWDDDDDVSVAFTVRLPKNVPLTASTVNGALEIRGAGAPVEAKTVNGSIRVETTRGPVDASTVNGRIVARMDALAEGDMEFKTVNGGVRIELPRDLDATVDLSTLNGGIESDFPLTLDGRVNPRHIRARIGDGGRRIRARTVNGGIELGTAP